MNKKPPLNTVVFLGRSKQRAPIAALLGVAEKLRGAGLQIVIEQYLAQQAGHVGALEKMFTVRRREEITRGDIAFVLGGDGTFLEAARHCSPLGVPLAGINLGYLGFLTDIAYEEMESAVSEIVGGQYTAEKRFMLSATVTRDGKIVNGKNTVPTINDIVISRGEGGKLVTLRVAIDGSDAYELRADGLIVSTPSGSTAYALSAGGPIMEPCLETVLLVPLCPHALSHRPLVVGANQIIELEVGKSQTARMHLDGRNDTALMTGDSVRICRHSRELVIYHPSSYSYFETLRRKLDWGG